ncbi:MAG: 30S ribosomal protein S18 [Anaerolineales bacterium]|nr:30S ribosomal protein S18 [Anaerolineales bacterium]MCW5854612.1 30S ribosomal protein S18 [Anaerolineales bacterium]MCW5878572.1 30S ribosomal protein S18 [Anaerolineales bacterium]
MAERERTQSNDAPREEREERGGRGGNNRYFRKPKTDPFEADKSLKIDYKDIELLKRFLTPEGKIRPRRQTGVNARNQRTLARAIKRARHIALLSYTDDTLD